MSGAAKLWVEDHFPKAMGDLKAALIVAYGAGIDAGLAEAQDLIDETLLELRRLPEERRHNPGSDAVCSGCGWPHI